MCVVGYIDAKVVISVLVFYSQWIYVKGQSKPFGNSDFIGKFMMFFIKELCKVVTTLF